MKGKRPGGKNTTHITIPLQESREFQACVRMKEERVYSNSRIAGNIDAIHKLVNVGQFQGTASKPWFPYILLYDIPSIKTKGFHMVSKQTITDF